MIFLILILFFLYDLQAKKDSKKTYAIDHRNRRKKLIDNNIGIAPITEIGIDITFDENTPILFYKEKTEELIKQITDTLKSLLTEDPKNNIKGKIDYQEVIYIAKTSQLLSFLKNHLEDMSSKGKEFLKIEISKDVFKFQIEQFKIISQIIFDSTILEKKRYSKSIKHTHILSEKNIEKLIKHITYEIQKLNAHLPENPEKIHLFKINNVLIASIETINQLINNLFELIEKNENPIISLNTIMIVKFFEQLQDLTGKIRYLFYINLGKNAEIVFIRKNYTSEKEKMEFAIDEKKDESIKKDSSKTSELKDKENESLQLEKDKIIGLKPINALKKETDVNWGEF